MQACMSSNALTHVQCVQWSLGLCVLGLWAVLYGSVSRSSQVTEIRPFCLCLSTYVCFHAGNGFTLILESCLGTCCLGCPHCSYSSGKALDVYLTSALEIRLHPP